MGEYDRKQQKQESRAVAYNGGGSRQLKGIVDNRKYNLEKFIQNTAIQRMVHRGQYDFSSNMHFAIEHGKQARTLYSDGTIPITPSKFFQKGTAVPINIQSGKSQKGGVLFERITPKAKLYDKSSITKYPEYDGPQDCVRYAAALVNNASNWGERYPLLHNNVRAGGVTPFDYSGAGAAAANPAANAHAGEMMYTTRAGWTLGAPFLSHYNFHGTTVIAVDGSEQITSEACVGSGRMQPNFMMYGNGAPPIVGQIPLQTFEQKYNPLIETPGVIPTDQVSGVVN